MFALGNKLRTRKVNLTAWHYLAVAILLLGALLRICGLNGAFTYDEAWSLDRFSRLPFLTIFSDFSLPNNHPLNTVILKYCFLADRLWTGRFFSFCAGLGIIILAGMLSRRLFGKTAAMLSMFACAIYPPLILYSKVSCGYSLQLFWMMAFSYMLFNIGRKKG